MAVSEEDKALFRQAVAQVRPLKSTQKSQSHLFSQSNQLSAPLSGQQQKARLMSRVSTTPQCNTLMNARIGVVTDLGADTPVCFAREGIPSKLSRRIKQGKLEEIPPCLDLHGQTLSEAHVRLTMFIKQHHQRRYLHIIHGKGLRTKEGKAPLKNYAVSFLMQHKQVLAIYSCPFDQGGTGAVFVLLKRSR